ncbi:MAG: hypothetical protein ACYC1M_18110 [Armatimonadota bacterium]
MDRYCHWIRIAWAGFAILLASTYALQHLVSGALPSVLVYISLRVYAVLFALSCIIASLTMLQSHRVEGSK